MNKVLLATHNRDKAREFQDLLSSAGLEVVTLDAFPQVGHIEEDADTLEGNALKKAREVFRLTSLPSIADDTGLEVHYLNKEPGVFSSRYAGPGATYGDNCRKLLEKLRGVPPRRRAARFRCVLVFVATGVETLREGTCRGVITEAPRGTQGFGYDPVFLPDGHELTFGEMELKVKNTLSHRARAIQNIKPELAAYFKLHAP